MKIVAISDTHGLHNNVKIPECDIILHAGDWCNHGTFKEAVNFAQWYSNQPSKYKVCIAGNHDITAEQSYSTIERMFAKYDIMYLENDTVEIECINIFGTPYTPRFMNWAFMHDRKDMSKYVWDKVPSNTNIILSHGPAYGILDLVDERYRRHSDEDMHVGCKSMLNRIEELNKLFYVVHGHIHGSYGVHYNNGSYPTSVNASICNEDYQAINKSIIFEI